MIQINFGSGKVDWNTLQYEDDTVSPFDSYPSEDLLTVSYEDRGFIIDVGWYRDIFAIKVVRITGENSADWGNLLDEVCCDNYPELYLKIQETIIKWDKG